VRGGKNLVGEFEIDAPELVSLWPEVSGRLNGHGQVSGTLDAPVVAVDLTGSALALPGRSIETLRVRAETDAEGRIDWDVRATGIEVGEQALGNLRASVAGRVADHVLKVSLTDGPVGVQLRAAGSWDGATLREQIDSATVETVVGSWTLRESVRTAVSADSLEVAAHCWDNAPAEACTGDITIRSDRWQVAASLARFPLDTFNPWLGGDVSLSGEANATLTLNRGVDTLVAEVDWSQSDTRIRFGNAETRLSDVSVHLIADERVASLSGRVAGDYGLELVLDARIEEPLTESGAVEGRLRAGVPDIGELQPLIDRYVRTTELVGALEVDARLSGTRDAPRLEGTTRLRGASAVVPALGITVADIALSVTSDGGEAIRVAGSATSGDGSVKLSGQIDWSPVSGWYSDIAVTGTEFELLRLPEQSMLISPDLQARVDDDLITLSGRVLVPEAAFVFRTLGSSAVAPSDDVVVHGVEDEPTGAASRVVGTVDIELGDAVTFEGLGVTTRLSGGLRISQADDGTPLSGEGSLQLVDGRYVAFGREMIIERGSLNFFGSLTDPVLDVRASRRLRHEQNDIKVGIELSGRLSQRLDFILFSEPGMSEADVLSYLIVGRPSATSEGVDDAAISGAAVAMGLASLTRGMGDSLSLDEISFEGGGGGDTSVVAGKRLSETVYVRYTYGLFSRVGTFVVRYDIGRGFSVEAGSGAQQTLDLIYSIDR
jgi:translocation and assembly module TamB